MEYELRKLEFQDIMTNISHGPDIGGRSGKQPYLLKIVSHFDGNHSRNKALA